MHQQALWVQTTRHEAQREYRIGSVPEDGIDPATLIEKADQAMYAVKRGRLTTTG